TKRTLLPSGVQPTAASFAGCHVSLRGSPPAAGMTYTSSFPSYCPVKAIHFPSGEKYGLLSCPPVVSWRASPPARDTLHRYPPYTNTISRPLIVGSVASSGASSAAQARFAATSNIASSTPRRNLIAPPQKIARTPETGYSSRFSYHLANRIL